MQFRGSSSPYALPTLPSRARRGAFRPFAGLPLFNDVPVHFHQFPHIFHVLRPAIDERRPHRAGGHAQNFHGGFHYPYLPTPSPRAPGARPVDVPAPPLLAAARSPFHA